MTQPKLVPTCPEPWTHAVADAPLRRLSDLLRAAIDLLDCENRCPLPEHYEAWRRLAKAVDEVQG